MEFPFESYMNDILEMSVLHAPRSGDFGLLVLVSTLRPNSEMAIHK